MISSQSRRIAFSLVFVAAALLAKTGKNAVAQNAVAPDAATATPIYRYDLRYAGEMARDKSRFAAAWDEVHLVSTLQGIVNRRAPRLYLRAVSNGESGDIALDDWWLDKLRAPGAWLEKRPLEDVPDLDALLRRFAPDVKGLVVYDGNVPATSNVASTIAGISDLLAVRYDAAPNSLFNRLQRMGFAPRSWLVHRDGTPLFTGAGTLPNYADEPSCGSAKNDAYRWAIRRFVETGRVSDDALAYYIDAFPLQLAKNDPEKLKVDLWQCTLTNHDYFVSQRAFFFDLGPWADEAATDDPAQKLGTDLETLKLLLAAIYKRNGGQKMVHIGGFTPWALKYTTFAGGQHEGVPTEWETVRITSRYNAYVDADALGLNGMANASFYTHQPLPKYAPEKPADISQYLTADGQVAAHHYVSFYVGDYDSAAWMYQMLPRLWSDPARGNVPMTWAFNPNLAQRFPAGFWYTRQTRSPNDWFQSGDSGAGYVNPGELDAGRDNNLPGAVAVWEAHNKKWFDQFGLSLTGFVIDGYAPAMSEQMLDAYTRFSPDGVVGQKTEPQLRGNTPFLRMSNDLPNDPQEAIQVIRKQASGVATSNAAPSFQMFRAVLKSPAWYQQVATASAQGDSDIVVVDGYTLMELARRQMKRK